MEEEDVVASDEEFLKRIMAEEAAKKKLTIEEHKPIEKPMAKIAKDLREVELPHTNNIKEIKLDFISDLELEELNSKDALAGGWDLLGDSKPVA
jgi:hypothetical protein